jgi:hypothetical protein
MTAGISAPIFDHLLQLTDHRGTFEHACLTEPRLEDGYCTDDVARVLVVAAREPDSGSDVHRLARVAVQFLNDAQTFAGKCRNRMWLLVLLDVDAASYPVSDESRHLLHIGITRAAHQLWLVCTSTPSSLLPPELGGR